MTALFLSSCVNEFWPGSSKTIGIKVVDIHATKASSTKAPKQQLLFSVPLDIEGLEDCYFEAWISDTEPSIATKGVQVNSGNIATSDYGKLKTYAYSNGEIYKNGELPLAEIPVVFDGEAWRFKDKTGQNDKEYFWPDEGDLTFCSYSPVASEVQDFSYDGSKVSLTYTYTSPEDDPNNDAVNQKDFMVGCDVDQNRHQNHGDATIHLCHGLTSVRFLNGEIKNLTVESVTLENFWKSGAVEFNTTDDGYGHFVWTPDEDEESLTSFTQTFNTAFDGKGENSAGTTNFDMTDGQSCTFMVIPQNFGGRAKDAKILIKTNREIHPVIELNLSNISENSIWTKGLSEEYREAEAGQLKDWSKYAGKTITFRVGLKEITAVSIEVTGDICAKDPDDGIKVTNIGIDPVYVRADIVVNTRNKDSKIVNSFLNTGTGNDFDNDGVDFDSVSSDWELNKEDGYWYSKNKLYPGATVNFISGFDWKRVGEDPVVELYNSKQDSKGVYHYYYNDYLDAYVIVQAVYGLGSKPESWK